VQERHYDLIHTHMPVPAVAARVLLSRTGPPLVHTEHNVWQRYRPVTRWANAATYGRNAAVIAVSASVAASITRARLPVMAGHPAVTVVLHGIDRQRVEQGGSRSAARVALGAGEAQLVLGTVGNCTPKKDQRTLLRAHAALVRRGIDTRLVLIGSGPLEAQLRQQVADLGTADKVLFAGSRDDVPRLLPGLDVFVLSSQAEGLPLALMEAMAAGLPCVSTAVGGVPEILTDDVDGRLVPPGNPDVLADVIAELAIDPGRRRRLGASAAVRAAAFDVEVAQRRIEAIYDRVLGTRLRSVA
jgi:glycosyltransferase involved in cell wall biosynthesis